MFLIDFNKGFPFCLGFTKRLCCEEGPLEVVASFATPKLEKVLIICLHQVGVNNLAHLNWQSWKNHIQTLHQKLILI